jgi:hypothetical protein
MPNPTHLSHFPNPNEQKKQTLSNPKNFPRPSPIHITPFEQKKEKGKVPHVKCPLERYQKET